MNNTFILLARSILDSEVFASQKMLKIWIWCLCKANYKDRIIPLKIGKGETTVKVKRGQFVFGRFKAEEELFIDGSTIYKIIKKLEEIGNIKIESNNQYSIVSICNYDYYQKVDNYEVTSKEQPSNNQVTAKEQPSNTDKKDKKDKKKYIYNAFYDNELFENNVLKNTLHPQYFNFVKFLFGENEISEKLDGVLSIQKQISNEQFEKLIKTSKAYNKTIKESVLQIENGKYFKNKKSFYLTLNKWITNERYG